MTYVKQKNIFKRAVATVLMSLVLSFSFAPAVLAADYNCGAYGAGAYDSGEACATTTPPPQSGGGSGNDGLVDTGQALSFGVPAALILFGTVTLYRLSRKKKH